jgi:hypothetical protein
VIRPESGVHFSRDLTGFHLYGTDICMVADILGWNSYVIDFHLRHLGQALTGQAFADAIVQFRQKWHRALRDRFLQTTCTFFLVTGQSTPRWLQIPLERWQRFRARRKRTR